MRKHYYSSNNSLRCGERKGKNFKAQMKLVFEAFEKKPSTMLMIAVDTGILRANICRFITAWKKSGEIKLIKKSICPISKHRAGFYSTDKTLFSQYLKR